MPLSLPISSKHIILYKDTKIIALIDPTTNWLHVGLFFLGRSIRDRSVISESVRWRNKILWRGTKNGSFLLLKVHTIFTWTFSINIRGVLLPLLGVVHIGKKF